VTQTVKTGAGKEGEPGARDKGIQANNKLSSNNNLREVYHKSQTAE